MDRVNAAGIPIPDDLPLVYYHPQKNLYWWLNPLDGSWQEFNEGNVRNMLFTRYGKTLVQPNRGALAPVDVCLERIRIENRLFSVANLGWEEVGIQSIEGERWLVKKGCKRIPPVKGPWPTIQRISELMLGEEQYERILGWDKNAVDGFYFPEKRQYGQALVLAGPPGTGKSLYQNQIITPMLGGKVGRPYKYLIGKTNFNSELFESVHLIAEDDFYHADFASRREFGSHVKQITANNYHQYSEKHGAQVNVKPYWRLSISLNNEAHYLATLPELDDSIVDKMMIFETRTQQFLPTRGKDGNVLEQKIQEELPAFIHYLLYEHEIREEIRDDRYGVKAYIHPDILERLHEDSPEENLRQALAETVYPGLTDFKVTSNKIMEDLGRKEVSPFVRKIAASQHSTKSCLEKLAAREDSGVKRTRLNGTRVWSLTFPPKEK